MQNVTHLVGFNALSTKKSAKKYVKHVDNTIRDVFYGESLALNTSLQAQLIFAIVPSSMVRQLALLIGASNGIVKGSRPCGFHIFFVYALCTYVGCLPAVVYANQQLDEVVVTATKTSRILADVPVRTRVISAQEVQAMHANKLSDVLVHIAGLQVRKLHGKTGSGVWMQGFDANRVLVLIDGNPIIPSNGSSVDISQIAVGDIERIEIIKGAVSSLYGTSAMGGVINVITKQPKKGFSASANLSSGNWGEQSKDNNPFAKNNAIANLSTKQSKWSVQMIADLLESKAFKANQDIPKTEGWAGHKNNLSLKAQYQFDDQLTLTLMPRLYTEDVFTVAQIFIPGFGYRYPDYRDVSDRKQLSGVVAKTTDAHNWKVRFSAEEYISDSFKASDRTTRANNRFIAFEASSAVGEQQLFSYGAQYSYDFLDSKNHSSGKHEVHGEEKRATEAYLQDSIFITNNFELMPGVLFNQSNRHSSHITPSINSLYKATDLLDGEINFRIGIGEGYRTPNLKELYYIFDHSAIGYMVIGNDQLVPETAISVQLSAEWLYPTQQALTNRFEFALFYNDIDNLIETSLSHYDGRVAIYSYQNIAQARTYGAELEGSMTSNKWSAKASYVYLNAKDLQTDKWLIKRPKHEVKLSMSYSISPATDTQVKYRYESEQFVDEDNEQTSPAFAVIDIKLNQTLNKHWRWYAGIDNLTGEQRKFDGTDLRPTESRFYYLGLSWSNSTS